MGAAVDDDDDATVSRSRSVQSSSGNTCCETSGGSEPDSKHKHSQLEKMSDEAAEKMRK